MNAALKIKNADFLRFARDPEIAKEVRKFSRENIKSARKLNGGETVLTEDDLMDEINSAVLHGVERAWVYRFLYEVKGMEPAEFFSYRRNKMEDYDEVMDTFPEFKDFIPATPLTSEEVIRAACEELATFLLGKGSDWYQAKLYAAFKVPVLTDAKFQHGITKLRNLPLGPMDQTLLENLKTQVEAPLLNSPIFSPVVIRIASYLTPIFGLTATTYWVFARYVYDDEYVTLIRDLIDAELETRDPSRFHALKVDLRRKLSLMDAALEALRDDPVLADYWETV